MTTLTTAPRRTRRALATTLSAGAAALTLVLTGCASPAEETAPAEDEAAAEEAPAAEETDNPADALAPEEGSEDVAAASQVVLDEILLTPEEFPLEGYGDPEEVAYGAAEAGPGEQEEGARTWTPESDTTLVECTTAAQAARSMDVYDAGANRRYIALDGDSAAGYSLVAMRAPETSGELSPKAIWDDFHAIVAACNSVEKQELTGAGLFERPTEQYTAFQEHVGDGTREDPAAVCFSAFQKRPDDTPQVNSMCLVAAGDMLFTVQAMRNSFEDELSPERFQDGTNDVWDVSRAQVAKSGVTLPEA
ncbi:hypothetical protein [Brevibacterium litoralis]|uniref:hypothetical protein n=1 Tax=Brevibacterium litoralis TaxID=3138935 RepID=UPI0032EEA736